jgi:four helix bundle protein
MDMRGGGARSSGGRGPRVLGLALRFVAFYQRYEAEVARARPGLGVQLQEAADSIVLNLGEGFDEPSRGDKRRFFRYALRSAGEAEKGLHALSVLNLIPSPALEEGLRLLRDIRFDLKRLINWSS